MAMNVGPADESGEDQLNNTINTTPLVDVMLVLLIIFLITIPVVTQSIKLELPQERNIPLQTKPEVHIRGDQEVRYESVGRVVVACQRAGIYKVGFITEPPAGPAVRQ